MTLRNAFEGLAVESKQETGLAKDATLATILTELGQKLESGGTVDLAPATVDLLRSVTAAVSGTVSVGNLPATYPDQHAQPLTDTQLRAADVGVTVSNPTANPETGLAKEATLQSLLLELAEKLEAGQEVALNAATLAALEQITATISNFPAEYPLPAAQVQTDALTDTQLRASAVPVSVANQPADPASESTLLDVKRALTDYEVRMDYDVDGNLIYAGKAAQGEATTATTWTIQRLDYTAGNLTRVQVLTGAWDDRTTLGWT